ncbi:DUF885 family protein [Sphingomonas sp. RB56-2]|uniref:DUF885 family protein n=1 Tax=Sphingomonas brevis TaxID=2908206 RepID=A0ABT0S9F7_9SPHN|nr:DUF885 family protein [Sphingomonas brevis]MCL6740967.1 DUF885 family protein [Sphingomonas brevis]
MDRREFLSLSSVALLPMVPVSAASAQTGGAPGDAPLNEAFDKIFNEQVRAFPTFATSLGLDKGANADLKSKLDTRNYQAARAEDLARNRKFIAMVEAVPPASLSPAGQLNREIVLYDLGTNLTAPAKYDLDSVQSPYLISQQDGAYFSTPDFLNSAHTIDNAADAEAYLSRLAQFATQLDNETAEQQRQAARGYVAPGWSLDLALGQMREQRSPAADKSPMVESIVTRTASIPGNWGARATAIVEKEVYPALDRQIAAVEELRKSTPAGDGAWRIPQGEAIYADALAQATTTKFTPDEVHQLGLAQVAEITAQLDTLLKAAGFTQGTVGERLAALNKNPAQLYPDTDEGRVALIASLNAGVKDMATRLPRAFATLPSQPLEIRRVPPEIQNGASNGYYRRASLDGSRPAIYFINLKTTGDWPKYSLPALTYHEGTPGHHLQISLAQTSADLPMLRKISFYSAYGEGWALYAEQLADELGAYHDIERAGYLQSYLFRATRLVVDTGMNSKRWSREKAIDYMVATTGFARPRVQREIERYCASIGQACSYKIGHIAWTRARARAQQILGDKFDLKQFHEVLKDGAMPLTILERRIVERAEAAKRA